MPIGRDGSGGGPGNGTISVVPSDLDSSAPGLSGAGNQVGSAVASTLAWADPGGVGITDGKTGSAFAELVNVWSQDLSELQTGFYLVGDTLGQGAIDYHATDTAVMPRPIEP